MNHSESRVKGFIEWLDRRFVVLRNGWPDFLIGLHVNGEVYFCGIEVKGKRDKLRPEQSRMHFYLEGSGIPVFVVRNLTETRKAIAKFAKNSGCRALARHSKPLIRKSLKQLAPPIMPFEDEWIG